MLKQKIVLQSVAIGFAFLCSSVGIVHAGPALHQLSGAQSVQQSVEPNSSGIKELSFCATLESGGTICMSQKEMEERVMAAASGVHEDGVVNYSSIISRILCYLEYLKCLAQGNDPTTCRIDYELCVFFDFENDYR